MKTLVIIIGLAWGLSSVFGQNYIGMSQKKIIKKFGHPDEKGENYFVYYDKVEGGINTYYFDKDNVCSAFVITRDSDYFSDYQRLLNRDFVKTSDELYVCNSKDSKFKAQIKKSCKEFNIYITPLDQCVANAASHSAKQL